MGIKQSNRQLLIWIIALVTPFFSVPASGAELFELPLAFKSTGVPTTATFHGGATADNGISYLPTHSPDDALDIIGEIHVEPEHIGSSGKIYTLIRFLGAWFNRAENGWFYPWDGDIATLIPMISNNSFAAVENFPIIEDLAFGSIGISDANYDVFLAYSTDLSPGDLYFSFTPIPLYIDPEDTGSEPTVFELYTENISGPIIQTRCVICHNQNGIAGNTKLVYATSSEPDYQETNFEILTNYILNEPGGSDLILSKPQGIAHGGGVQLPGSSQEFQDLQDFVTASLSGTGNGNNETIFADVESASKEDTLRKAALLFAGRLPTETEFASVADGDETDLRQAVRNLMEGDGFTQFLMESANDHLLTQAYSVNLFDIVDRYYYPNSRPYFGQRNFDGSERRLVAEALAEEPLRLIAHVVTNNRPYTEILTADYIMVNPYSAEVYGGNVVFNNPSDPEEWREGELTEYYRCNECRRNGEESYPNFNIPTVYPHAGILNSPAFLSRFPSTSTNRNRARARWAYYFFLGVDIEGLSERTTDPDALADENNPTLNNPNCTVCHDIMDPVAGAFQNYSDSGYYRPFPGGGHALPLSYRNDPAGLYQPGDTWYADMLLPGFNGEIAPNPDNSLQWLAQEFVNDGRFGFGTVKFWFPAVIGRAPLNEPENPEDTDYAIKLAAYTDEFQLMNDIANNFVDGSHGNGAHNLKDLLTDLVMSNYFRAESSAVLDLQKLLELDDLGVGRLLTPEQLNRKLVETTGFEWGYGQFNALLDVYGLNYGGIDSLGVTERASELTTLMSSVVTVMANETSCAIVAQDFGKLQSQRLLFPFVELDTLPTTNPTAIKSNIQYLHERLLGENLGINDTEIETTYSLFSETWNARIDAGKDAGVSSETELCLFENAVNPVEQDPNQTLRSWAVVMNYLLRDFKFIHE